MVPEDGAEVTQLGQACEDFGFGAGLVSMKQSIFNVVGNLDETKTPAILFGVGDHLGNYSGKLFKFIFHVYNVNYWKPMNTLGRSGVSLALCVMNAQVYVLRIRDVCLLTTSISRLRVTLFNRTPSTETADPCVLDTILRPMRRQANVL